MFMIEDRAECAKALNDKLENLPRDTLAYIQGAIDMAGMLDTKNEDDKAS